VTTISLFDEPEKPRIEPAGFWIRAAARGIDWLVIFAIVSVSATFVVLAGLVVVRVLHGSHEAFLELVQHPSWFERITWVLATLVYHSVCEGAGGATIGKRLLGLQVVAEDFGRATLMQGMRRSAGFLIDALFFGAVGANNMNNSPMRQRIGDTWGKTFVVRRKTLPPEKREPARIFAAAVVAAGAAAFHTFAILSGVEVLVRMGTS